MWIEKLSNGKFKYVERYTDPLTGKSRKASLTHTKKNARVEKEMFLKLQDKIGSKTKQYSSDITFSELAKRFMKVYKGTVRASTYEVNNGRLNTITEVLGDAALSKATPAMFNKFLLDDFEKGYSFDTVNSKRKLIKRILSFGLEYGFLSDVTLPEKIAIQRLNVPEKDDWKFLEKHELQTIIECFQNQGMNEEARLCTIQAATGLRFNELAALDYKKHINFSANEIYIERSYDKTNKIYTLPKNNKKRTIYVKDSTLNTIREQIQYDQLKMMSKQLDRNNTLLFRTTFDNPYPLKAMNKKLQGIKLKSGKHLTTHIFRHTFITMMIEAGVDAKLIAEHVGHADTKMIDWVYSHFTETMDQKLKQAVLNIDII